MRKHFRLCAVKIDCTSCFSVTFLSFLSVSCFFSLAHTQRSQGLVSTVSESLNPAWQTVAPGETANVTLRLRSQAAKRERGKRNNKDDMCCSASPIFSRCSLLRITVGDEAHFAKTCQQLGCVINLKQHQFGFAAKGSRHTAAHAGCIQGGSAGSYRGETRSFLCFHHKLLPISLSVPDGDVSVCLMGVWANQARLVRSDSGHTESSHQPGQRVKQHFSGSFSTGQKNPTDIQLL